MADLKPMYAPREYSPETRLTQQISTTADIIIVEDGALLDPGPNFAVIFAEDEAETIRYEHVVGNELRGVIRAIEPSDTPMAWEAGASVVNHITAEAFRNIQANIKTTHNALGAHADENIGAPEGVHGIRFNDGYLQLLNPVTGEWENISSGGSRGIPIGNVLNLEIQLDNQALILTWGDPENIVIDGVVLSVWGGTMVRRKTEPWLHTDDQHVGTLVVDNVSRNAFLTTGFVDIGLENGVTYYYKLFPYNDEGRFTIDAANEISGSPAGVPAQVTNPQFAVLDRAFSLSWTNPNPADYWVRTVLVRNTGGFPGTPTDGHIEGTFETATLNTTAHTSTGLDAGETYFYRWFTMNALEQFSSAGIASLQVEARQTPEPLIGLNVAPNDGANALSWQNPNDPNRAGILLVWSAVSQPSTPQDGTPVQLAVDATTFEHVGLVNDTTTYFYALFAHNTFPADSFGNTQNFSAGIVGSGTPSATPGAPTNFTIIRLDGQLVLRWTHSSSATNEGTRIVYNAEPGTYPATPTDGTVIDVVGAPGSEETYFLDGLVNGTTYYFSLFSYNNVPNFSAPTQNNAAPIANTGPISNFTGTPGDSHVVLSWTNPGGTFAKVTIVRRLDGFHSSISDGVVIYEGDGNTYTDTGLTNEVEHFYRAFTSNGVNLNDTTDGQQIMVIPQDINPVLSQNSWAQIASGAERIEANGWTAAQVAANLGWNIGDTLNITLSTSEVLTLQIYNFRHDELPEGGRAGITFGMRDLMAAQRRMNATTTNVGSFPGSEMWGWITGTLWDQLPADLRAVIKPVNKRTSSGNNSSAIRTDAMSIFFFSEVECFGTNPGSFAGEGTQYPIFTDSASRIKRLANGTGEAAGWWGRSPVSGGTARFRFVNGAGGSAGTADANNTSIGVCFGLCV